MSRLFEALSELKAIISIRHRRFVLSGREKVFLQLKCRKLRTKPEAKPARQPLRVAPLAIDSNTVYVQEPAHEVAIPIEVAALPTTVRNRPVS